MKVVLRIVILLVLFAALAWFGVPLYLRRSVAQYDGTIKTGVSAPVSIAFDAKGVPQIWAKTDGDAFFAIGFLHGSERLFQMELVRRLARGELSEVFGAAALDTDIKQRQIGFARQVRSAKLDLAARAVMQRYVDGVNAAISSANVLAPEFVLLRFEPRPWTIEDCLTVSNYQTWFSHELMDQDKRYQRVIEKLGLPAQALARAGHPWSPPAVESGERRAESGVDVGVADRSSPLSALRPPLWSITTASNSWVIAPSQSASRAALHAADPHLSIDQVPGLWYLAGLHSEEGLNVVGVTYAGGPLVVMGHNADVAWSFTVASVDLIDYYDDAPQGEPIREEIRVKGEERPRIVEVRRGARGMMIDGKTSLRWAGFDFDPGELTASAYRLQRAKTFDEFRTAVTKFGALDANWIYSDRHGNIGYQLGAPIPIRDYDTYTRQDARHPNTVWRGYRALEETPHALNPQRGFLASCNNQPVSKEWPYPIPGFYDPYRIPRATALLPSKHTVADMRATQLDLVSGIAVRWKELAAKGASVAGLQDEARMLLEWDGRMTADSKAATLFAAWWRRLPHAIFEDDLGSDWDNGRALLDEALTTRTAIDDKRTPQVEALVDVSARAMRDAKRIANGRTWGEACTLLIRHPLSRVKVLDTWLRLDRGPFPGTGDPGTLNANFYSFHEDTNAFRTHVGPSMRFVLDWADVDAFTLTGALGQSGNPFSPHYDDFLPMAQKGEHWNVPFSREKVEARTVSTLTLTP